MTLPQQWSDILPHPTATLTVQRDKLLALIRQGLNPSKRSLQLRRINDETSHLIDPRHPNIIHAAITLTRTGDGDYLDVTFLYYVFRWNPDGDHWYGGRCMNTRAPCVADADSVDTILPNALMLTILFAE